MHNSNFKLKWGLLIILRNQSYFFLFKLRDRKVNMHKLDHKWKLVMLETLVIATTTIAHYITFVQKTTNEQLGSSGINVVRSPLSIYLMHNREGRKWMKERISDTWEITYILLYFLKCFFRFDIFMYFFPFIVRIAKKKSLNVFSKLTTLAKK